MDPNTASTGPRQQSEWLAEGGTAGARIRAFDWSATPLGPLGDWPQHLRAALNLCLESALPSALIWGDAHILFHNDICDRLFPQAMTPVLGSDFRSTPWYAAAPVAQACRQTWKGKAATARDVRFLPANILQAAGDLIGGGYTLSFSPIRSDDGKVDGLFLQTVPAAASAAQHLIPGDLQELSNAALLERVAATSPDIVFIHDLVKGRNIFCSARIKDLLGYTPEEFTALPLFGEPNFLHPDDEVAASSWIDCLKISADDVVCEFEHRARHARGDWRWMQVRAVVFRREKDGSVRQFLGIARDVTPHKRALESARLNEERHRFSLEAGEIGAWEVNLENDTGWRSPTYDRIFGYSVRTPNWNVETFLGHVVLEDRAQVEKSFRDASEREGSHILQCRIRRVDGTVRWIEVQGRSVRMSKGSRMRLYGTVRDITEQLSLKQSLERQSAILQMILNGMTEGVLVCSANGDLMLVNDSAQRMLKLGTAVSNVYELSDSYEWTMADGKTEFPKDQLPLGRALNGETIGHLEGMVRCPRREVELFVACSSAPLRDAAGQIVGAVGVFRDMTESRRALEDLHNAEQHFKLLVEGTTDYAIFMLDADGKIASWNPGAQRILGYEQAEVLGRPMSIFYTEEDIAKGEPQRKLQQTIEEGRAEEDSWRVCKDGHRFWCTGVLDALHDGEDKVRGFVEIMRDNTERRLAEENTYFLANHDALTGLPNRARFLVRLHEALINADRDSTHVAVLLLDLDRFKLVNDTLGHHIGDMLLQQVAARLSACIRETDTVARLGGDEFVVILTRLKDIASIESLAAKIVQEMARPFQVGRHEVRSGTSLGVALYRRDGSDAGDLLQKADLAMYRAKSSGRNKFRIFTASMLTEVQARREQEDNLRHALEKGEFVLSFQPQIDLGTLRLTGAEVLLRSRNRVLQALPASRIIELAEETGLIVPLGEWVLEAACKQLHQWQAMGLPEFHMAVNFSPAQLLAPGFIESVRRIVKATDIDPKWLEFEVTEGLLVAASEGNNGIMTSLKQIGVSISVDDFGTGFSALSYLKNFPVDVLKLDESLVRHLPRDQEDVAIVSAIIKLALDLNIRVVAEGVETADQLAYLKTTDCSTAQGFLFSPAVGSDKFETLLQNRKWSNPAFH